ncbi:MAG: pyridoxamine 5'-phosphate oxidase family protein [Halobacteriales archaeon]|nr:pyridoxamine 5'-phosphate oxidase family protein [Halobacteriales archaeon]
MTETEDIEEETQEDPLETEDVGMRNLSDEESEEVLRNRPGGILSMCDDGEPYAIPMTYGYHDGDLYFEFGTAEEGRKFEVLERNPRASLTVYAFDRSRWGDSTANVLSSGFAWVSVIATGDVEKVDEPSEAAVESIMEARRPSPANPWGDSIAKTELNFYRMNIEKLSGRTAGGKNPAVDD